MISVIIPVHNSSHTLGQCLRSLQSSEYRDFEIIVVDDGSTDRSVDIARRFPCRTVTLGENEGPAAARHHGAKIAKGEILLFLDSDTAVFPNTLQLVADSLKRPGVDAVIGIYRKEPLNKGFFPEYYAYLKHFSFIDSCIINVLYSGQEVSNETKRKPRGFGTPSFACCCSVEPRTPAR